MKLLAFLSSDRFAWGFAFVFLLQAVIFFCVSPNMTIYHWVCVVWLGLMVAVRVNIMDQVTSASKKEPLFKKKTLFIASSAFYVLGVMAMFPISGIYSYIFLIAIGFWFMGSYAVHLVAVFSVTLVTALVAYVELTKEEEDQREEFVQMHDMEQVVLKYVDKKDPEHVQVFVEGKGIYGFSSASLGQNLKDGDTVRILIYQNEIISLER